MFKKLVKQKLLFGLILIFGLCIFFASRSDALAFLENGGAARSEAMGRSSTALADDLDAYYFNPAGYAVQDVSRLNSMYSKEMNIFDIYYFGYGQKFLKGYAGLNIYMSRVDDIPKTDYVNGQIVESGDSFEYSSKAIFLSYAMKMEDISFLSGLGSRSLRKNISLGLNFKYINEILYENKAAGMGLDLGLMYYMDDICFGATIVNIIEPIMAWDTESGHKDVVPRKVRLGVAYTGLERFKISVDMVFEKYNAYNNYGVEYLLHKYFSLRAGINPDNYSFGIGLHYGQFDFDYVYLKSIDMVIDDTQKFSLGYLFDLPEKQVEIEKEMPKEEKPILPKIEEKITTGNLEIITPNLQENASGNVEVESSVSTENKAI